MVVGLGQCRIEGGTHERNHFCYLKNFRMIVIDFDSDYVLRRNIGVQNPAKALAKAKRIARQFLDKDVTVEELVDAGFWHSIPGKRILG